VTAGVIFGLAQATGYIADPYDARAYWQADPTNLYLAQWVGGYVYPPPLALALNVLHPIGWFAFITAFTTATWVALWYCTRALAPVVLAIGFAAQWAIGISFVGYLFLGNIQIIMAAAIVASIRVSPAWSVVPILTKLVPVSLVWYTVRREWRNLAIAVGVTGAVVAVTVVVAPGTWVAFARFVTTNAAASPLPLVPIAYPVRLVMAVALVAWGGLTGRRWTVPIAAGLAIPALYVWSYLAVWIGAIGAEWPYPMKTAWLRRTGTNPASENAAVTPAAGVLPPVKVGTPATVNVPPAASIR
jgi:hypothetical protein